MNTPATDINRSAEKTLDNWRVFVTIQVRLSAIQDVKHSPLGVICAPQMENELYNSMLAHLEAYKA